MYIRQLLLLSCCMMCACSSLPKNLEKPISEPLPYVSNPGLLEPFANMTDERTQQTGFMLLENGLDAFVARVFLANTSQSSIDAQYYLLHDDLVGRLFLSTLLKAADRGVRVRLLLDDIGLRSKELGLAELDAHPHFEIRVFNPFSRRTYRFYQYVSRFGYVTRRMHNKAFIVDRQAAILGGRNMGNEYFEAHPKVGFGDLDILLYGPIVSDVDSSFEEYWNHTLSYPLSSLDKPSQSPDEIADIQQSIRSVEQQQAESVYIRALEDSPMVNQFRSRTAQLEWAEAATLIHDSPGKLIEDRQQADLYLSQFVSDEFTQAQEEIIILSPYFLPGKQGTKNLIALVEKGIKVKVLTNSLASNNHSIVYAHYAKYRKALLDAGIELYEARGSRLTDKLGDEHSTQKYVLHAKAFVVDRKKIFVGSLNFDPRSFVENTEIGVVLDSKSVGNEFGQWFDTDMKQLAYQLRLNDDRKIVWVSEGKADSQSLTVEPETTLWQRTKIRIMKWLPIESQL